MLQYGQLIGRRTTRLQWLQDLFNSPSLEHIIAYLQRKNVSYVSTVAALLKVRMQHIPGKITKTLSMQVAPAERYILLVINNNAITLTVVTFTTSKAQCQSIQIIVTQIVLHLNNKIMWIQTFKLMLMVTVSSKQPIYLH